MPAQEGLYPDYPLAGQVQFRLVMQYKPVAFQGGCQLFLLQQPPGRLDIHRRGKELIGVAADLLGPVHGEVCVFHQGAGIFAVVGNHGDPDTDGYPYLVLVQADTLAKPAQNRLGDAACSVGIADARKQHHKFVTTEPRHRIFFPDTALQPLSHLAQQFVTGVMAQGVVDSLEPVQVQEHQGGRLTTAPATAHHMVQSIPEQLPVCQPGQRIVEGQAMQF